MLTLWIDVVEARERGLLLALTSAGGSVHGVRVSIPAVDSRTKTRDSDAAMGKTPEAGVVLHTFLHNKSLLVSILSVGWSPRHAATNMDDALQQMWVGWRRSDGGSQEDARDRWSTGVKE